MKRYFTLIVLFILAMLFIIFGLINQSDNVISPNPAGQPDIYNSEKKETKPGKTLGNYAYLVTETANNISLIANFQNPKTAKEIAVTKYCRQYINGAFYDTERKPLGYFVIDGNTLRKRNRNTLIDAVLWQDNNGKYGLDFPEPKDPYWAIQTGPMLVYQKELLKIKIKNDEASRRSGAILTAAHQLLFFTVFEPNSVFDGPLLSEMPEIVKELARDANIDILNAVNLDGGSASTFSNGITTLQELVTVGSLFCLK